MNHNILYLHKKKDRNEIGLCLQNLSTHDCYAVFRATHAMLHKTHRHTPVHGFETMISERTKYKSTPHLWFVLASK